MSYVVDLGWPEKVLSPNARGHWSSRARAVKSARLAAWIRARVAIGRNRPSWGKVAVSVEFCPPDKRRRDMDNLIASMKASFDGIADAIGIDDRHFIPTYAMGEPVKGGLVRVSLSPVVESTP